MPAERLHKEVNVVRTIQRYRVACKHTLAYDCRPHNEIATSAASLLLHGLCWQRGMPEVFTKSSVAPCSWLMTPNRARGDFRARCRLQTPRSQMHFFTDLCYDGREWKNSCLRTPSFIAALLHVPPCWHAMLFWSGGAH